MKRVMALVVAGAVAVMLTACGQEQPKPTDVKIETQPTTVVTPQADENKAAGATSQE